jgi:hypothetical protein
VHHRQLRAKYKADIQSGDFVKPNLPSNTDSKNISKVKELQSKLNEYLAGLCHHPRKEFLHFLQDSEYAGGEQPDSLALQGDDSSSVSSVLYAEKELDRTAQASQQGMDYLQRLWCTECSLDVSIRVNYSSFVNDVSYIISIAYRDAHFQIEKSFVDICALHKKLKRIFRDFPVPEFPIKPNVKMGPGGALDRGALLEVESWFKIVLNDADLLCSELHKFFGWEIMTTFAHIYQLNQERLRDAMPRETLQQTLGFTLNVNVVRYGFELGADKNIRMVRTLQHRLRRFR